MLIQRNTDCENTASIAQLLEDIDCKLNEFGKELYNNVIFALNHPIEYSVFFDLIVYRRILTYRLSNSDYALPYTDEMIASKVKLLKYK